jgi:hypothetical protein
MMFTDNLQLRSGDFPGAEMMRLSTGSSPVQRPTSASAAPTGAVDSAGLTQAQWAQYQSNYSPVNARMMELADDTSIVDAAKQRIGGIAERSQAQIAQVTGRRLSSMSPAQRRAIRDRLATVSSTDSAATMHSATIAQRDLNNAAMSSSLDTAAQLNNQAISAMSQVDAMKAERDAKNAAAKKAAKGGFMSTLGTIVGGAAGFMMGGPMGASLGASLGGSVGGGLGG